MPVMPGEPVDAVRKVINGPDPKREGRWK